MKRILFFLFVPGVMLQAQTIHRFSKADDVFAYADTSSAVMKTGDAQSLLAYYTKLTAIGNTLNLRSPINAGLTNNTELPVSFIPAEIFGGPAGTFREVQFGQQYVNTVSYSPQIDIINASSWQRVRSAVINQELTANTNALNKKALLESASAAYYNIVSLQEQEKLTAQMLQNADSLVGIISNKQALGLVRLQDLNNARINRIAVADKLQQIRSNLAQQKNSLKILCDIPAGDSLSVESSVFSSGESPYTTEKPSSQLSIQNAELKYLYARSELRASRYAAWTPTVSLVFNQNWQSNSNAKWWDSNAEWFGSQYVGLRISFPIPPDVNRISQSRTAYTSMVVSRIGMQHAQLEQQLGNVSQEAEYSKAFSSYASTKEILSLRQENYKRSLEQFSADILTPQQLIDAFNDLLNSQINYTSASANAWHQRSRILISKLNL